MRKPDFLIGDPSDPYLRRWYLIPRNRWFNVYLHHFRHSDDERALHDHPYINASILLRGRYIEVTPKGRFLRRPGAVYCRRADALHRVELLNDQDGKPRPVWTVFITGPRIREWGFACPQGWRHWKDFTNTTSSGSSTGRGCE